MKAALLRSCSEWYRANLVRATIEGRYKRRKDHYDILGSVRLRRWDQKGILFTEKREQANIVTKRTPFWQTLKRSIANITPISPFCWRTKLLPSQVPVRRSQPLQILFTYVCFIPRNSRKKILPVSKSSSHFQLWGSTWGCRFSEPAATVRWLNLDIIRVYEVLAVEQVLFADTRNGLKWLKWRSQTC